MATTKKSDSGKAAKPVAAKPAVKSATKPAAKKTAAKKPATKPAAKKATAKKPVAKTVEVKAAPVKKISAARAKAKAEHPVTASVPGRKERRGVVVSSAMDKTIVVRIDAVKKHDVYGKVVRRSSKLHAHDENNVAGIGDLVRVVETRPLSATKHWRLIEILEKAK
jgi:small subunit ribosomal protein S17